MKRILPLLSLILLFACSKKDDTTTLKVTVLSKYNSAKLSWEKPFTEGAEVQYKIYINDSLVAEANNVSYFYLRNLSPKTDYSGYVEAMSGTASMQGTFSFTTKANVPPEAFAVSVVGLTGDALTLAWDAAYDPDNVFVKYNVLVGREPVAEALTQTSYQITGLQAQTAYSIVVEAVDDFNNKTEVFVQASTIKDGAQLYYLTEKHGYDMRSYGIYIPSNSPVGKVPVMMYLHGHSWHVWPEMITRKTVQTAERDKYIFIMPQARGNQFGDPAWQDFGEPGLRDFNFIENILDTAILKHNADPERLYLTGFSNGGFMTYTVAKVLEHRLAAIAPIGASISIYNFPRYSLQMPMPLCHMHCTGDSTVQELGNSGHYSVYDVLDKFIAMNGAETTAVITELPDRNTGDGSRVTKIEYPNEHSSASVVYYRIKGSNHSVPGTTASANQDIYAFDVVWDYFKTRKLSDK